MRRVVYYNDYSYAGAGPQGPQEGFDVYTRFFGPWAGIDEDPVTGSAFSVVAPYFSSQVLGGKQQMVAQQCSARGGVLHLDLAAEPGRVLVAGKATLHGAAVMEMNQL